MRPSRHLQRFALLSGLVLGLGAACGEQQVKPRTPLRVATPLCQKGPFATEMERLLPLLAPLRPVGLFAPTGLDPKLEPGCVVPFRKEPDDRLIDVGRVVAKTSTVGAKEKPVLLGRGRLEVGRRALRLRLMNAGGDEVFALVVDGAHVTLTEKGKKPFETVIKLGDDGPLPLPLDALVASVDVCDADQRLGRTDDGNLVEATREGLPLWRTRWLADDSTAIVDTSVVCGPSDTRLVWRTAVGDLLPMLAVASKRSDRTLVIVRQGPTDTESVVDYGFDGMR